MEESETSAPVGRPTDFTPELADRICAALAEGESLRSVCREDDMPAASTVFSWLRLYPQFLEQYEKAKEESADALAEDILDIADDGTNDFMERENDDGSTWWEYRGEAVQRSRLRVDTRKWIASKLKPKKYGERTNLDHTSDGKPIHFVVDPATLQRFNDGDSTT